MFRHAVVLPGPFRPSLLARTVDAAATVVDRFLGELPYLSSAVLLGKEEEVLNRITKMAAKLHFSGDRSSILGMKVSANVTNWGTWMTTKRS